MHNAFFWAIDRSQDVTFMHDWFSKTGQGVGGEYRYNFGPGANGNIRGNFLDEHETTYVQSDGRTQPLPASQSYEIHGSANQTLPGNLHARGRVDYFSSLVVMQSVQMDYANAYQNQRSYGGNVVGAWRNYSLNATVDHTDYFSSSTASSTSGSWPRVSLTRNERIIPDTPLYFSVGGEFAGMLNHGGDTTVPESSYNRDVNRVDFTPQVRFPVQEMAVVHGQHDGFLARHLLLAEPVGGGSVATVDSAERDGQLAEPCVLYADRAAGGTCVQQDLGHTEQRLRREVQAHRRTVSQHQPHVGDRQLQPDHPDRRHGHHRRRRHAIHLRFEQPVLRQAPGRGRAAEPGAGDLRRVRVADLLHEFAGLPVRPALFLGQYGRGGQ